MAEDIELGESRFPKAFDRSNFKSQQEPDYFTPITNGTYFAFQQEENSNLGQENTTGRFLSRYAISVTSINHYLTAFN